jgi:Retrotransposon gag protein
MDDGLQVSFAMSNLGGRARSWAYSAVGASCNYFGEMSTFKAAFQEHFEPSEAEFRLREVFLHMRQGRMDIHEYVQRARYLVSCISQHPIDPVNQASAFMSGLCDGAARTQIYREYPKTLEEAISIV